MTQKHGEGRRSASGRSASDLFLSWGFLAWCGSVAGALTLVVVRGQAPLVAIGFATFMPLSLISWCLSRGYLQEERYPRGRRISVLAFVPEFLAFVGLFITDLGFPQMTSAYGVLCLGLWAVIAFALRLVIFRDLSISLLMWNTWLLGAGALTLVTERFTFLGRALDAAASGGSDRRGIASEVVRVALELMSSVGIPLLVGGTAFLAAIGLGLYYWTARRGGNEDRYRTEVVLRAKAIAYAVGFVAFAGFLLVWFLLPLMALIKRGMQLLVTNP